jgi:hypothetical protein
LIPACDIHFLIIYDANDRFTAGDTYDNNDNGNTVSSGGIADVYDFENHLIQQGGVKIVYDGDGNRVFKTVAGNKTGYLVDMGSFANKCTGQ